MSNFFTVPEHMVKLSRNPIQIREALYEPISTILVLCDVERETPQRCAIQPTEHAIYRLEPVESVWVAVEKLAQQRRAAAHVRHQHYACDAVCDTMCERLLIGSLACAGMRS